MRILLAISALVLAAILWAVISIMQHVRVSRRQSRLLREHRDQRVQPAQVPATSAENISPLPARFAASAIDAQEAAATASTAQFHPAQSPRAFAPQALTAGPVAARTLSSAPPALAPPQETPALAPQSLRILEFVPSPVAEAAPAPSDPRQRRPVRSAPPPPSSSNVAQPTHRQDWIYFNKDMGDLSDPTPSRVRDRVRAR